MSSPDDRHPTRDTTVSTGHHENVRASRGFLTAFVRSFIHPTWMPSGVNDFDTPLEPGQVPVVLVHGTWLNAYNTWSMIAPTLAAAGYRVFALNYGRNTACALGRRRAVYGAKGLLDSQREVAAFVDEVIERTGARQVDLVGHSQGVTQSRLYLTDSGGADPEDPSRNRVRRLIGIGGSNHGTTMSGLTTLCERLNRLGLPMWRIIRTLVGQAAEDQVVGSPAMRHVNRMGDTVPGVTYTMLCSRFDQIVTPWRTQYLEEGPGATVHNVLIQQGAVRDFSDHLAVLYSPRIVDFIEEALSDDAESYRTEHPYVSRTVLPFLGAVPEPPRSLPRRPARRLGGRRGQGR